MGSFSKPRGSSSYMQSRHCSSTLLLTSLLLSGGFGSTARITSSGTGSLAASVAIFSSSASLAEFILFSAMYVEILLRASSSDITVVMISPACRHGFLCIGILQMFNIPHESVGFMQLQRNE